MNLGAYIRLTRPANIPTALADIMLAAAASGYISNLYAGASTDMFIPILLLCFVTACLYAGAMVVNDLCDMELDVRERPERPLPRGAVTRRGAIAFAIILYLCAMLLSIAVGMAPFITALLITALSFAYNVFTKGHIFFGPLTMGAVRSLNLALGLSLLSPFPSPVYIITLIPLLYIWGLTFLSSFEVHGAATGKVIVPIIMNLVVILFIYLINGIVSFSPLTALPFIVCFIYQSMKPLVSAFISPDNITVRKAVKAGVLALITLDAALASGFAGLGFGIGVALLGPLSYILASTVDVT